MSPLLSLFIKASIVISTMPIDELYAQLFGSENGSFGLRWRGVRILYIHIDKKLDGSAETYYFPSLDEVIGRISEVNKYSPYINTGMDGAWLTIEIPASEGDYIWQMQDEELLNICMKDLLHTKILSVYRKVKDYFSLRLEKAYPVYEIGWREKFQSMYEKLHEINNLFTVGRGGLFLHCNIDHSIEQGIELARYILQNKNDAKALWNNHVKRFLTYCARD